MGVTISILREIDAPISSRTSLVVGNSMENRQSYENYHLGGYDFSAKLTRLFFSQHDNFHTATSSESDNDRQNRSKTDIYPIGTVVIYQLPYRLSIDTTMANEGGDEETAERLSAILFPDLNPIIGAEFMSELMSETTAPT